MSSWVSLCLVVCLVSSVAGQSNSTAKTTYLVKVTTGNMGLDPEPADGDQVFIKISGEKNVTDFKELKKDENAFKNGSEAEFTITAKDVGNITAITIKKTATSLPKEDWRLRQVVIEDSKGTIYEFQCMCWISKAKGLERTLKPSKVIPPTVSSTQAKPTSPSSSSSASPSASGSPTSGSTATPTNSEKSTKGTSEPIVASGATSAKPTASPGEATSPTSSKPSGPASLPSPSSAGSGPTSNTSASPSPTSAGSSGSSTQSSSTSGSSTQATSSPTSKPSSSGASPSGPVASKPTQPLSTPTASKGQTSAKVTASSGAKSSKPTTKTTAPTSGPGKPSKQPPSVAPTSESGSTGATTAPTSMSTSGPTSEASTAAIGTKPLGPSSKPTSPGSSAKPPGAPSAKPSAATSAKPSGPASSAKPSGPASSAKPSGPASSAKPSGPSSNAKPSGPSSNAKPSGPSSNAKPSGPSSSAKPSGPSSNAKPSGPSSNPTPSGPSSNAKPSGPSSNAKPSGPSSSAKPSGPSSNAKPSGPSSSAKPSGPSSNAKPSGPSSSAKPSGPAVSTTAKPSGPSSSAKPSGPAVSTTAKPSGPSSNAKPSGPSSNAKPSGPSSSAKPSGPSSNAKPSGPSSSAKPSGPSSSAKPSGPSSSAKPSGPSSSAKPSGPAVSTTAKPSGSPSAKPSGSSSSATSGSRPSGASPFPSTAVTSPGNSSSVPTTSPTPAQAHAAFISGLLHEMNVMRLLHGVGPLLLEKNMSQVAQKKARKSIKRGSIEDETENTYGMTTCKLAGTAPGKDAAKKCVSKWYATVKDFDWSNPRVTPKTSQFAQLVWKATTHVGIGVAGTNVVVYYDPPSNEMESAKDNVPPVTDLSDGTFHVCPEGFRLSGSSCFKFIAAPSTWGKAIETCAQHGATLASLQSQEENTFVNGMVSGLQKSDTSEAWIGFNDRITESSYQWVDGSIVKFHQFLQTEPTGIGENCVALKDTKNETGWEDRKCTDILPSFCRRPAEGPITYKITFLIEIVIQNPSSKKTAIPPSGGKDRTTLIKEKLNSTSSKKPIEFVGESTETRPDGANYYSVIAKVPPGTNPNIVQPLQNYLDNHNNHIYPGSKEKVFIVSVTVNNPANGMCYSTCFTTCSNQCSPMCCSGTYIINPSTQSQAAPYQQQTQPGNNYPNGYQYPAASSYSSSNLPGYPYSSPSAQQNSLSVTNPYMSPNTMGCARACTRISRNDFCPPYCPKRCCRARSFQPRFFARSRFYSLEK